MKLKQKLAQKFSQKQEIHNSAMYTDEQLEAAYLAAWDHCKTLYCDFAERFELESPIKGMKNKDVLKVFEMMGEQDD